MFKKVIAILMGASMVLSSAVAVTADETEEAVSDSQTESADADTATVGDDAQIKESLEGLLDEITDEKGSFDPEKMRGLIGMLFGPSAEDSAAPDEFSSPLEAFAPIEEAIDLHTLDATADSLEEGDETIFSHVIASIDFHEDDTIHMLGYFTIMNFDKDEECPDDLVMKNGAGTAELLTLTKNEDGTYEVTDCMSAEDGEGYADSIKQMCEDIDTDPETFYEALALSDLMYLCDLHDFMEAHPEYDHIEYMGELNTLDDLHEEIDDEFTAYLSLYAIDEALTDAAETEAEPDSVDFEALKDSLLSKIGEAAAGVDLEEKEAVLGAGFSEEGTVFALLQAILADVEARKSAEGADDDETLEQALNALSSLEEVDEAELDDLLNMAVLGIIAGEVDEKLDEESKPDQIEIANTVANFVFEAVKENDLIAEAVEETGSRLFEMIENSSKELKAYVDSDGTMDVIEDIPEEPFEDFEAELSEVTEYIEAQEGPKHAALDLLDLLHDIVDEIHLALHGHTHEALE